MAEIEGTIVGFVSWKSDIATRIGETTLSAVHQAHAGRGVGTARREHAPSALKAAGLQQATVGDGR